MQPSLRPDCLTLTLSALFLATRTGRGYVDYNGTGFLIMHLDALDALHCFNLPLNSHLQPVTVPEKHCDDRVKVIQADARTLSPALLAQYAPDGFDAVVSDMVRTMSVMRTWLFVRMVIASTSRIWYKSHAQCDKACMHLVMPY